MQADKRQASLKEQLASVTPLLEELRVKKEERVKQFADIRTQIQKITSEMTEFNSQNDAVTNPVDIEEHDLSIRKLNEYKAQLQTLQKEKVFFFLQFPLIPYHFLTFPDSIIAY